MVVSAGDRIDQPVPLSPAWTVRAYRPGDETQLAALFESVFGRPQSEAQWRWKLCSQPVASGNSWVAVAGDRIVGHYGGTPMRYWLTGRERLVMHGCNAMTANDFRRQGILTAVHGRANEVWSEAGIPFQTGLHYGGWGSRREFLGWQPLFRLVWVKSPLRPFSRLLYTGRERSRLLSWADGLWKRAWDRWLRLGAGRRDTEGVTIREVTEAGPEFDRLWEEARQGYQNLAVRDRAWVSWRFFEAPDYGYRVLLAERDERPAGYLAYRVTPNASPAEASTGMPGRTERRTGWIADLFAALEERGVRRLLLRRTLLDLSRVGAESAVALVPAGTAMHRELRRAGFLFDRGDYDFSIVLFDPSLAPDSLRDPSGWLLSGADFDVV